MNFNLSTPECVDSALTEQGISEAKLLQRKIVRNRLEFDLVLVSPMTRALQTCQHALSDLSNIVVLPCLREYYPGLAESMGSSIEQLLEFDFEDQMKEALKQISPEWDGLASSLEHIGSPKRVQELFDFLSSREERRIAIFCHWGFINNFVNTFFFNYVNPDDFQRRKDGRGGSGFPERNYILEVPNCAWIALQLSTEQKPGIAFANLMEEDESDSESEVVWLGQRVTAIYEDNQSYPGIVYKVEDDSLHVKLDDFSEMYQFSYEKVSLLEDEEWSGVRYWLGSRVEVWWAEEEKFYTALVVAEKDDEILVKFDDFHDQFYTVEEDDIRLLQEETLPENLSAKKCDSWPDFDRDDVVRFLSEGRTRIGILYDYNPASKLFTLKERRGPRRWMLPRSEIRLAYGRQKQASIVFKLHQAKSMSFDQMAIYLSVLFEEHNPHMERIFAKVEQVSIDIQAQIVRWNATLPSDYSFSMELANIRLELEAVDVMTEGIFRILRTHIASIADFQSCAIRVFGQKIQDLKEAYQDFPRRFKVSMSNIEACDHAFILKHNLYKKNCIFGWHLTTSKAADAILASNFHCGKGGMLGKGIYFGSGPVEAILKAENGVTGKVGTHNRSVEGTLLVAEVTLEKPLFFPRQSAIGIWNENMPEIRTEAFSYKLLQHLGYDSVIYNGPTGDEFVVYSPDQVRNVQKIAVTDQILEDFKMRRLVPLPFGTKVDPYSDASKPLEAFLNSIGITHNMLMKATAPFHIHTTSSPPCLCFLTFLHRSSIISVPVTPGKDLNPAIEEYLSDNALTEFSWEVIHVFDWNCFCEVKSWNFLSFLIIIDPVSFDQDDLHQQEDLQIANLLRIWLQSGKAKRNLCIDQWGGSDKKSPEEYLPTQGLVSFVIVLNEEDEVLLVEERDGLWFLPAGQVDPAETFGAAACRETVEETGVEVELLGVTHLQMKSHYRYSPLHLVFEARPVGGSLKTEPDEESRGSFWRPLKDVIDEIQNPKREMVNRYRKPRELRAIFQNVQRTRDSKLSHSLHSGLNESKRDSNKYRIKRQKRAYRPSGC